jgi:hypothetical protein
VTEIKIYSIAYMYDQIEWNTRTMPHGITINVKHFNILLKPTENYTINFFTRLIKTSLCALIKILVWKEINIKKWGLW